MKNDERYSEPKELSSQVTPYGRLFRLTVQKDRKHQRNVFSLREWREQGGELQPLPRGTIIGGGAMSLPALFFLLRDAIAAAIVEEYLPPEKVTEKYKLSIPPRIVQRCVDYVKQQNQKGDETDE